ncbi:hypothetical protein [Niallia sp. FSL R7-0271]
MKNFTIQGKVIQDEQTIEAKRLLDKVTTTLSLSDKVVNGDPFKILYS